MISDVTIRFCEAFDKLLAQGETTGQKDFASKVGMSTSMMTEIVKKRSNVGVTVVCPSGVNTNFFPLYAISMIDAPKICPGSCNVIVASSSLVLNICGFS